MKLFLASFAQLVISFVLPVLLVRYVPRPRHWRWRALIAIIGCWLALAWFMTQIYCPLSIAEAERRGDENPEARCDNNNVGPLIIMGWFFPAIPLGLWGIGRWLTRKKRDALDETSATGVIL
jgi:hypothetical protein